MKLSSVSKLQSHSQSNHAAYHKSEIIMPSTHHHFYDLNFKLKIVAEVEAVKNNHEIAHEYGILESIVRKWRNQQQVLFTGELKMTVKCVSMGFM